PAGDRWRSGRPAAGVEGGRPGHRVAVRLQPRGGGGQPERPGRQRALESSDRAGLGSRQPAAGGGGCRSRRPPRPGAGGELAGAGGGGTRPMSGVVSLAAAKGSPGVTFLTAALACRLAEGAFDVLAVDADAEDAALAIALG